MGLRFRERVLEEFERMYLPDQKVVFGGDLLVTNRPDPPFSMS
jgi:hypothetical protein